MRKLLAAISLAALLAAQTDDSVNARIRKEAAERSQIMHTLHMLTDRYGPRLTGSPNLVFSTHAMAFYPVNAR